MSRDGRRNGALRAIRRAMDRGFNAVDREIRSLRKSVQGLRKSVQGLQKSVQGLRKTTDDLLGYVVLLDEESQVQKRRLREHIQDTVRHLR